MKLETIVSWLDRELKVEMFDDVSNNGIQIDREGDEIAQVAFAVDASVAAVKAASEWGAQLLVVHHGISWGGGIRRVSGGVGKVIREAIRANLAVYAVHLPLDANRKYGNNYELARFFGLKKLKPAFKYHGNVIGVTGYNEHGKKIGICSGGAGEFAETAKAIGCDLYITGEANWGEVIAARNVGMEMVCGGHYNTETFGVKALARGMAGEIGVKTDFLAV